MEADTHIGKIVFYIGGVPAGQKETFQEPAIKTILPIWVSASIRRKASAALASGNVAWMTGFTFPASISGQTCWLTAAAMAPFSSTARALRVEPVKVSRFSLTGSGLTSVL